MNKLGRGFVAILIALIIVAGVWIFFQMRSGNPDEATVEVVEPNVVDADELPQSQTVRVANYEVQINPDPRQVTVLAPSQTQQSVVTPLPAVTDTPNFTVATQTPIPVPTAEPTANNNTVIIPTTTSNLPSRNNIAFVSHTVSQGETLYGIASRYGSSVSLMAEYSIAQDHLYAGNVINVPVAASNACTTGQRTHIVLEGENVFRIAIRYGTTREAIRAANPVINDSYLIYAGDVICIP